nr:MAG TPA: hypothetical protein [Caudoviricetes sp.]
MVANIVGFKSVQQGVIKLGKIVVLGCFVCKGINLLQQVINIQFTVWVRHQQFPVQVLPCLIRLNFRRNPWLVYIKQFVFKGCVQLVQPPGQNICAYTMAFKSIYFVNNFSKCHNIAPIKKERICVRPKILLLWLFKGFFLGKFVGRVLGKLGMCQNFVYSLRDLNLYAAANNIAFSV